MYLIFNAARPKVVSCAFWGPDLNTFRAFILDANNRIIRSEILTVATKDEALDAAIPFAAENDLEVWLGDRRLATIRKGGLIEDPNPDRGAPAHK